jgi:ribonuclease P/MRP protein subunit RPP1
MKRESLNLYSDVDLISFDLSRRLDFHLKGATLALAIKRGVFFEITYSTALTGPHCFLPFSIFNCVHTDSTTRRHLISNAMNIIRATNGKNIIITSEAKKALDIRNPYDIAAL